MGKIINPPVLLTADHRLDRFACGYSALDDWLKNRALANQESGGSRCYVVEADGVVIGYYTLAAGNSLSAEAPGKIRRNMPDPIPVMVLGRLAVDVNWQGTGLGSDMLRDALLRSQAAARIAGMRALLVHAIDEGAARFYQRHGFMPSPNRPLVYFLPLHPLPQKS